MYVTDKPKGENTPQRSSETSEKPDLINRTIEKTIKHP